MFAANETPDVSNDAAALVHEFDGRAGDEGFHLLANELVRKTVVVLVDFYVIIDVRAYPLDRRERKGFRRERPQSGPVQFLKEPGACGVELAELPVIQLVPQLGDRAVEFSQSEECPVS